MPTGYTAIIDDHDATFEQYVWRCARAFGALLHMRDDDMDADIRPRDFGTSYHDKTLADARSKLAELLEMTPEQAQVLLDAEYEKRVADWERKVAEAKVIDERYERMRERVTAWEPPTPTHEAFKDFMLEQLDTGRSWTYANEPKPVKSDVVAWLNESISDARRDIEYHSQHIADEQKRKREADGWVQDLKRSVPYVRQPDAVTPDRRVRK